MANRGPTPGEADAVACAPMRVIIEAPIAEWWGVADLLADMPDASVAEQDVAIVKLLSEDVSSLLDGATWRIERSGGEDQ